MSSSFFVSSPRVFNGFLWITSEFYFSSCSKPPLIYVPELYIWLTKLYLASFDRLELEIIVNSRTLTLDVATAFLRGSCFPAQDRNQGNASKNTPCYHFTWKPIIIPPFVGVVPFKNLVCPSDTSKSVIFPRIKIPNDLVDRYYSLAVTLFRRTEIKFSVSFLFTSYTIHSRAVQMRASIVTSSPCWKTHCYPQSLLKFFSFQTLVGLSSWYIWLGYLSTHQYSKWFVRYYLCSSETRWNFRSCFSVLHVRCIGSKFWTLCILRK